MLPARLSPRDLGDYRVCPRRLWYRRVAKLPAGEQQNALLMLGNAVHAAMYLFLGLPVEDRHPAEERLHQCLRKVWKAHRTPGLFGSREEEQACGQQGLQLLSNYARSFSTDVVPVLRERWVQTRLPNGIILFGKTDRIDPVSAPATTCGDQPQDDPAVAAVQRDLAARGEVDVVDYKTGRWMTEQEHLPDDPAAQIYLLGAEATLKRPVRRVRIIYLAHGAEVRWEPEREDVDALRDRLTELTDQMIDDRTFEPQPGPHCTHCPFAERCPDAGRTSPADLVIDEDPGF